MVQILTNLSFLALAGLVMYPVLRLSSLQSHGWRRSVAFGALLGVAVSVVILEPLVVDNGSMVDGRVGPLAFAGFLGGVVGGAVTWVAGVVAYAQLGEASLVISAVAMAVYVALGLLYCWLTRRSRKSVLEWKDVGLLALIVSLIAFGEVLIVEPRAQSFDLLREYYLSVALANAGSTLLIGACLRFVLGSVEREKMLTRVQERLELACESAGLGIWDWNLRTNEVVWDQRLARLHGVGKDGFQGLPREWLRKVLPEDRRRLARDMRRLIRGEGELDTEARVVIDGGETRHLKTNGLVVRGADGRAVRVVGVNQDLSSLRRVEQDVREIGWRFEDLASSIPGVIGTYVEGLEGEAGTVEYVSPGCEDVFEMTAEKIVEDPSALPMDEDPVRRVEMAESLRVARETSSQWTFDWCVRTASGKVKWLQGRGLPRLRRDGRWQWSIVVLDITEQVRIKEALERNREIDFESRKMEAVGRLTGGVAHDFNNLLSVIVGALSLLSLDDVPDEVKESIHDALAACDRGASLTQQLLAFGRQAPLTPTTLEIRDILAHSQHLLERTLPERIEIICEHSPDPCLVSVDRSRLERALLNLGLNARDAMPSGGTIRLRSDRVDLSQDEQLATELGLARREFVRVTVADTGPGMTAEVQEKAFEPFFTTKEVNEGSGLGLAMVHGFVRQSAGAVRLQSAPGQGTRVELYFPLERNGVVQEERPTNTAASEGGSEHILLVEDDRRVRKVLSKQLRRLGYRLTVCVDGGDGLEAIEQHADIDVLLTDVVMPGDLQGPQLAAAARRRSPGIGVVFMTGYSRDFLSSETFGGDHVHLAKPFRLEELDEALRQVLPR